MATYRGFSFKNWQRNKSFVLTDVELVKQDLLNHIFTDRGSRIGLSNHGTTIHELLYDQMDDITMVKISDQVKEVINYDPRVIFDSIDDYALTPNFGQRSLQITATLYYVELDLTDVLQINLSFDSQ